jgi:dihydroorotase
MQSCDQTEIDKQTLCKALKEGKIDVIATDHAPHTLEEKSRDYLEAPSGLPLVQHPLNIMLTLGKEHGWGIEFIVEKMAHNPAICFGIKNRGFLREEYFADLVILDPTSHLTVRKEDLLYKCGWSPLEGAILEGKILSTFVNGHLAFDGHKFYPFPMEPG